MSSTPQNPSAPLAVSNPRDSFIPKLPDEMISKIFTHMLADEWCCVFQTIPPRVLLEDFPDNQVVAPLHLGAICWRWRNIAWATPQLWTSISIEVDHDALDDTHLTLFRACVARSGSLPLRLRLSVDDSEDVSTTLANQPPVRAMMTAFLASSRRVVDLEVRLPDPVLQLVRWGPSDPQRPALKRLHLVCVLEDSFDDLIMSTERVRMGAVWDGLTHVVLSKMHFRHVDIAWDNLTHVDVKYFSASDCLQLLRHAVKLTHLDMELKDRIPEESAASQPVAVVVHSRLRHLILNTMWVENRNVVFLLKHIRLPVLEVLDFWIDEQSLDDVIPKSFRISLISLTGLIITKEIPNNEDCRKLVRVLRDLPSLEYLDLSLEDGGHYDHFFKSLASFRSTEGYKLLPKLKELKIDFGTKIIKTIAWELIPPIFSPFGLDNHIASGSQGLVRRPLCRIHLIFGVWESYHSSLLTHYIECDVVHRLISLMDTGVTFRIGAHIYHESGPFHDVLQSSIKFHKLSKADSASVHAPRDPL